MFVCKRERERERERRKNRHVGGYTKITKTKKNQEESGAQKYLTSEGYGSKIN
jgi:hypothetical protein